ncbi:hypothetical protein GBW32_22765 [Streptomyces tsukubensis]|uniref:hypothetical protein n=1 Tax=Streptomyces tsukubensis TaxID=83656 RepID=UPI00126603A8|nr:hypothetical protein [Streptomyces tsukubensis]QFR95331.1 hypothetical protein GBW32_22765 [Streptomyces tsukubensis]
MAADLSFFTSPLSESIRDEGRNEGRAEGRDEGRAQDILRLLDGRGVPLLDADRDRITHCHDLDVLSRWFGRAITATTAEEVFADAPTDTTPGGQPQS